MSVRSTLRKAVVLAIRLTARLVVVPLARLIEPFWKIRITHLWCARFGPLAYNTHLFVGERRIKGPERRTWRIFVGAKPVNRQLFDMWKRVLPVVESLGLSFACHAATDILTRCPTFELLPNDIWAHPAVAQQPVLAFTAAEERRGKALLRELGLGEAGWFVCFQARDPLYHNDVLKSGGDSGSHRNCAIETFMPAVGEVTRRGGFAIRTGAAAERPVPETGNPRILDYTKRARSDFGDIYLGGRCRFLLAAATGSVHIPALFGIPVAMVNALPVMPTPIGPRSLYLPKLLRDKSSGRILSFFDLDKLRAFDYDYPGGAFLRFPREIGEAGLEAVDNSADDVLGICLDMLDRLDGVPPPPEMAECQAFFKERFLGHKDSNRLAPDIGGRFLLAHPELLSGRNP